MVLKKVVVPLLPRTEMFELGVACEVFGFDRSDDGLPTYDFSLSPAPDSLPDPLRLRSTPLRPDEIDDADLVVLPAGGTDMASLDDPPSSAGRAPTRRIEPLFERLRAAVDRGPGSRASAPGRSCSARRGFSTAAVHHPLAARRAARRDVPRATVDPNVLYVDDGSVLTSAGTAAGIDLCLHIVRTVQGSRSPTRSPGAWSSRRTATAVKRSTSRCRCRNAIRRSGPAPRLDDRESGPRPARYRARRAGAHVAPHLRAAVRRRDRHHSGTVAQRPARSRPPAASGELATSRSTWWRTVGSAPPRCSGSIFCGFGTPPPGLPPCVPGRRSGTGS